jgi:hypothetical protein
MIRAINGWIYTVSQPGRTKLHERDSWLNSPSLWYSGNYPQSGPFWTLTTLILTIFLSTSLGTALFSPHPTSSSSDPSSNPSTSEKDLTLLTFITTLIYVYGLAFPAAFWALTRYFALKVGGNEVESGSGAAGAAGWTLPEAWAIWGYGMVVWVPVSVSVGGVREDSFCVDIVDGWKHADEAELVG